VQDTKIFKSGFFIKNATQAKIDLQFTKCSAVINNLLIQDDIGLLVDPGLHELFQFGQIHGLSP
jgi:hypothetical protein